MANEPLAEPVDRSSLSDANSTVEATGKVILDNKKTGFAVESLAGSGARLVFGGLMTSEHEICGQTLPRDGGLHGRGFFILAARQVGQSSRTKT